MFSGALQLSVAILQEGLLFLMTFDFVHTCICHYPVWGLEPPFMFAVNYVVMLLLRINLCSLCVWSAVELELELEKGIVMVVGQGPLHWMQPRQDNSEVVSTASRFFTGENQTHENSGQTSQVFVSLRQDLGRANHIRAQQSHDIMSAPALADHGSTGDQEIKGKNDHVDKISCDLQKLIAFHASKLADTKTWLVFV